MPSLLEGTWEEASLGRDSLSLRGPRKSRWGATGKESRFSRAARPEMETFGTVLARDGRRLRQEGKGRSEHGGQATGTAWEGLVRVPPRLQDGRGVLLLG